MTRPRIIIDPAVRFGRPHIEGTQAATVDVAGMVIAGESVATVAEEYGLTRHEVLLACWHEGADGHWQAQWGDWATAVHDRLGGWKPLVVETLPNPPVHESRCYVYCLECDHVYPTARALRRTFRRCARRTYGSGMRRERWRAYLTRAQTIRFCPRCLHDL